jgi:hypothetical protein
MACDRLPPHPQTGKPKSARRKPYPPAEELREHLSYNPCTGQLRWRVRNKDFGKQVARHNRWFADKVAGTLGSRGYIHIGIGGRIYLAHRLAWIWWYGFDPEEEIDHENRIKTDNRIINLRVASGFAQAANKGVRIDNVSGFKGVSFHRKTGKWRAKIRQKHIGYFETAEAAYAAYLARTQEEFGAFSPIRGEDKNAE